MDDPRYFGLSNWKIGADSEMGNWGKNKIHRVWQRQPVAP